VEEETDVLWCGTFRNGFIRVTIDPENITQPKNVEIFNDKHGLGSLRNCLPYKLNDKMVFVSDDGIYKFNKQTQLFEHDCSFGEQFCSGEHGVYQFLQTGENEVLLCDLYNERTPVAVGTLGKNNEWTWYDLPFRKVPAMFMLAAYKEADGTIWVGGSEGVYKFNPKIAKNYEYPFKTFVRKAILGADSVVYDGYGVGASDYRDTIIERVFSSKHNSITFEYASNDYEYLDKRLFSFKLEGFEDKWSEWSTKTLKEYTNLSEGDYTFHVKSMNIYGFESETDSFTFSILPPWYRTWWAYLLYIVSSVLLV